jgi:hypothetical protein
MSGGRGAMTDAIKFKSQELLGYAITVYELRLLAYLQYVMMNDQKIDPQRINAEERSILSYWRKKDWIKGGAAGLKIRKTFWDAMNELLYLGYVCRGEG